MTVLPAGAPRADPEVAAPFPRTMADYVKNYHVLYTHYRQPMGGDPRPLLEPEHHILYLDM